MKFSIKAIASIMAAITHITSVSAEGAIAPEDSAVVKLTEETFEEFISSNPYVLAEFFAPWCGHCKNLGPEFASAADSLNESNPEIKLAQIDCTVERDLCSKMEIRGYPTMKVFKGDADSVSDYPGQRNADSIANYMIKLTLPAVQVFEDAKALSEKLADVTESFILQVLPAAANESASNNTFYDVANKHSEHFTFASTSDPSFVEKYANSTDKPAYVIFRKGEVVEDASVYKGEDFGDSPEALVEFISVETKPLFGEINGSTYQAYTSSGLPLAYYFYNTKEQREAAEPIIKKIAKEFRGEVNFVGLDASQFGMHAQNLNMQESFPLFVIHDIRDNKKYGIDQSKDLDNSEIENFVKEFKEGKLEPIVKSEPIPESQDSPVYHLVGKEHDDIVNSKKDVLVKYYAPWCGHCKKLAPIYEELSALYKGKDVILAELDHTKNDVDGVDIQGYPTLVLFPADGSDPVYFEQERSLESMANFIKEHGALKIDILAEDEDEEDIKVEDQTQEQSETAETVAEGSTEHDEL